ncbi:MAG: hypothetical protein L0Z63_11550 [Actinobacteria bacterium]|nr:hypothetical protein [Actinomycetota bacterium]
MTEPSALRIGRALKIAVYTLVVLMAFIVSLIIWSWLARTPSHEEILEHQVTTEAQLAYLSCLLIIHPDQRTPEAIAGCQINP